MLSIETRRNIRQIPDPTQECRLQGYRQWKYRLQKCRRREYLPLECLLQSR